ncbi:hypothetical protein J8I87_36715 [Paraburkholderia sp. LEh10]|uniref:hypothetical protein n=1 Tax=Paraburkholderia sp. LEh10 TaxID=2821353 RepID=UPI001AE59647|nr:hypothetical protein [Paraburkholderia sp. LEh10]MBP0595106.1 hypothetical protein [Paraburkholderia sp. LEh10]
MARTSIAGRRVFWVLVLCIAATGMAVGGALMFELSVISRAVSDFSRDEGIEQARASRGDAPSREDRFRPPYLMRYGLDPASYTDAHGRFSPTGADWREWSLRTKVAATVMWLGHNPPGTWWTLRQIKCVDRFHEAHADNEPIVDVADACLGEPH